MKALSAVVHMPNIDRPVIEALRRGEEQAYKAVIDLLLGPVYRFLLRLCGDSNTAEDLTQETFLAVWQSIGSFKGEAKFKTWAFGIAYHQFLRYRDMRVVDTAPLDESEQDDRSLDPLAALQEADEKRRVHEAIEGLPDTYREVFCLVHLEGFRYREVARVLGIPLGTVKSRMNVAFKLLRERLGGSEVQGNEVRKPESLSGW